MDFAPSARSVRRARQSTHSPIPDLGNRHLSTNLAHLRDVRRLPRWRLAIGCRQVRRRTSIAGNHTKHAPDHTRLQSGSSAAVVSGADPAARPIAGPSAIASIAYRGGCRIISYPPCVSMVDKLGWTEPPDQGHDPWELNAVSELRRLDEGRLPRPSGQGAVARAFLTALTIAATLSAVNG